MKHDPLVRHNLDTGRVVTACECGKTVSLPDYALSEHLCACGRGWKCDGSFIAMYVPKGWMHFYDAPDLPLPAWRRVNSDYLETSGHLCPTCGESPDGCVHQQEKGSAGDDSTS